jgi:SRSO17 transposase
VVGRYRELLPAAVRGTPGTWVVHDGVIPKKGRHSVGTQRQFARSLGRKVNCQVAVVVGRHGPGGYAPLAVRLYLPGFWLRESAETVEKTVPAEFRTPASKGQVATGLFDELAGEGWTAGLAAAEDGYLSDTGFREVVARHVAPLDPDRVLAGATAHFEWLKHALGLDHFEGRNWLGWHHHAALVLAAYGFLATESARVQ